MGVIVAKGVGKMLGGGGSSSGGGLGGLLGGLAGGNRSNTGGAGGLGDLLGGLSGQSGGGAGGGGLGDLLNNALQGNDSSANAEQDSQAEVMLRAMISAAKSDGELDDEEKAQNYRAFRRCDSRRDRFCSSRT
ncbi:hypothetical protein GQR58_025983 [Nymphon striatum]|nr:hypothetical protein GQR58_025983 [Nymphon striatum]